MQFSGENTREERRNSTEKRLIFVKNTQEKRTACVRPCNGCRRFCSARRGAVKRGDGRRARRRRAALQRRGRRGRCRLRRRFRPFRRTPAAGKLPRPPADHPIWAGSPCLPREPPCLPRENSPLLSHGKQGVFDRRKRPAVAGCRGGTFCFVRAARGAVHRCTALPAGAQGAAPP